MEKADTPEPSAQGKKTLADQHIVENIFERALWSLRFIVILGVIFGALSAIVLFVTGSIEIYHILVVIHPGHRASAHP